MSSPRNRIVFMAVAALMLMASVSIAERHIVTIDANSLTTITPEDQTLGKYYVLSVDVPNVLVGKEFLGALLEFAVDVSARATNGFLNETPVLEVYALTADYANELDPSEFKTPSSMRRNVVVGNDRVVKIDIKEVVKGFLDNPESNHGLVIGSLTNTRDGFFTIKQSSGRMATITYYYLEK